VHAVVPIGVWALSLPIFFYVIRAILSGSEFVLLDSDVNSLLLATGAAMVVRSIVRAAILRWSPDYGEAWVQREVQYFPGLASFGSRAIAAAVLGLCLCLFDPFSLGFVCYVLGELILVVVATAGARRAIAGWRKKARASDLLDGFRWRLPLVAILLLALAQNLWSDACPHARYFGIGTFVFVWEGKACGNARQMFPIFPLLRPFDRR
jgi:hypothetical protein